MADAKRATATIEREPDHKEVVAAVARKIPIANLYHMLCYAWDFFELNDEVTVVKDTHRGYAELLTQVLTTGCVHLLKQGLHRDYEARTEPMPTIRGKLELAQSLATGRLEQGIAVCTHDEFTADIPANQVLKSVLMRMARLPGMNAELAAEARRTALRMPEVSLIEPDVRMLGRIRVHQNNRFYGFLLSICRLILDATSVKENRANLDATEQRFYGIIEKRLFDLFESFVRNFYAKHLTSEGWTYFGRRYFEWQWGTDDSAAKGLLPRMETDITLEHPDRKIIMDTKFYGSGGISRGKFDSNNLYQLNSYVTQCALRAHTAIASSESPSHPHDIDCEGMLLYATVDDNDFHHTFEMPPHRMAIATVNLDRDWKAIEARLLEVVRVG